MANSRQMRQEHAQRERQLSAFCTERFRIVSQHAESKQLTQSRMPAIIISASGMATGGRVLHHLKAGLPGLRATRCCSSDSRRRARAAGSLVDGARSIKIHGHDVIPVHAHVETIDSMSAHADSEEILRWLGGFKRPPALTFIVHGEPVAMEALQRVRSRPSSAGPRSDA